jgi:hypothetical protein
MIQSHTLIAFQNAVMLLNIASRNCAVNCQVANLTVGED